MKKYLITLLFLFPLLSFAQKTYIQCGKLIDVKNSKVLEKKTIVINGNTIESVVDGFMNGTGDFKTIDLKNKTVMPGLIDCHVHIESETSKDNFLQAFTLNEVDKTIDAVNHARTTLYAGFTTVRDLGGSGVNIGLKKAINNGKAIGPRIYTAGTAIGSTGSHADPTIGWSKDLIDTQMPENIADGVDACVKAVRQQYKNGADLIKVMATGGVLSMEVHSSNPQFSEEEMRAICLTAADCGLKVAAHAHGAEGMKRAIRAGVASLEHATLMDDEVIKLMKEKGTYYVPTLTAGNSVADSAKIPGYYQPVIVPKALELGPIMGSTFTKAYKAGVKIAFGTDASVFQHGKNYLEFLYMSKAGMPAMEILRSATVSGADLLGLSDKIGSIEKGKMADLIAVDGDPLKDLSTFKKISFIMKDGKIYSNE